MAVCRSKRRLPSIDVTSDSTALQSTYEFPLHDPPTTTEMPRSPGNTNVSWDATDLLKIRNPFNDTMTCIAHAPSQRRRCRIRIKHVNQMEARAILEELPRLSRQTSLLSQRLDDLADLLVCHHATHQEQAHAIADLWYDKIIDEVNRAPARAPARRSSRIPATPRKYEPPVAVFRFSALRSEQPSYPPPPQRIFSTASSANDDSHKSEVDNECPICLKALENPYSTPCGHVFCHDCLESWFGDTTQKTCPMDRQRLSWSDIKPASEPEDEMPTCPICFETFDKPCRTPCGHTYCRTCLAKWFAGAPNGSCPLDRRRLAWHEVVAVDELA